MHRLLPSFGRLCALSLRRGSSTGSKVLLLQPLGASVPPPMPHCKGLCCSCMPKAEVAGGRLCTCWGSANDSEILLSILEQLWAVTTDQGPWAPCVSPSPHDSVPLLSWMQPRDSLAHCQLLPSCLCSLPGCSPTARVLWPWQGAQTSLSPLGSRKLSARAEPESWQPLVRGLGSSPEDKDSGCWGLPCWT